MIPAHPGRAVWLFWLFWPGCVSADMIESEA